MPPLPLPATSRYRLTAHTHTPFHTTARITMEDFPATMRSIVSSARALTRFEEARVVALRAHQLAASAPPLVKVCAQAPWNPLHVAQEEFRRGALGDILTVLRYQCNGSAPERVPATPHPGAHFPPSDPGPLYAAAAHGASTEVAGLEQWCEASGDSREGSAAT